MKIIFITPEALPFAKTGGLADVCFSLPKALASLGYDVSVVMPGYRSIKGEKTQYFYSTTIQMEMEEEVLFRYTKHEGVNFYFVFCDKYFDREGLYQEGGEDYSDNAQRFSLFCKASIKLTRRLSPNILHCHDWQSGLVPALLKKEGQRIPVLFTIHNMAYQGLFPPNAIRYTGLDSSLFCPEGVEFYGKLSFLKAGILFADIINTVSCGYAEEIKRPEFGFGLDGLLRKRNSALYGVLNGIDYKEWDPETDTFIHKNYSHANITGKRGNKKALCKELRLLYTKDAPLLGTVTRLVEQKGVDIILSALPKIVKMGASFVLLGTGEKEFEKECMKVAKKYPKQVSVNIKYDNALAHRIYAGVDVFCMPSRFEPCGLGQMISLRYGTLPLVRCTGGLADTVKDIDEGGTGFVFHTPSADAFSDAVKRAITTYSNKRAWSVLVKKAMRQDFSWRRSATDYVRLYKAAIEAAS